MQPESAISLEICSEPLMASVPGYRPLPAAAGQQRFWQPQRFNHSLKLRRRKSGSCLPCGIRVKAATLPQWLTLPPRMRTLIPRKKYHGIIVPRANGERLVRR